MAKTYQDLRYRSLFILLYLTGGRLTELVPCTWLYKNIYEYETIQGENGTITKRVRRNHNGSGIVLRKEKRLKIDYPGVLRKNIIFTEKAGKDVMVVNLQNRKNPRIKRKNIPVPVHKEGQFINLLREYINALGPEDPLFNFKADNARKIIALVGMNPHFLRDIRLTHLVTLYDFSAFDLMKFAGWTNPTPARHYIQMSYKDLVRKF